MSLLWTTRRCAARGAWTSGVRVAEKLLELLAMSKATPPRGWATTAQQRWTPLAPPQHHQRKPSQRRPWRARRRSGPKWAPRRARRSPQCLSSRTSSMLSKTLCAARRWRTKKAANLATSHPRRPHLGVAARAAAPPPEGGNGDVERATRTPGRQRAPPPEGDWGEAVLEVTYSHAQQVGPAAPRSSRRLRDCRARPHWGTSRSVAPRGSAAPTAMARKHPSAQASAV